MHFIQPNHDGSKLHIGIVQARFSSEIGDAMLKVCTDKLMSMGVDSDNITIATVPGALEIPLVLNNMVKRRSEELFSIDIPYFDALIAIGAVIRGETYHFELVANECSAGISRIGIKYNIPIANAVLTTENDEQAYARIEEKAVEAAIVAVECGNLIKSRQLLRKCSY